MINVQLLMYHKLGNFFDVVNVNEHFCRIEPPAKMFIIHYLAMRTFREISFCVYMTTINISTFSDLSLHFKCRPAEKFVQFKDTSDTFCSVNLQNCYASLSVIVCAYYSIFYSKIL